MNDAAFLKIRDLLNDGRMEEAAIAVNSLTASDPEDVRAWILEATVCETRGDLIAERSAIVNGLRCDVRNYELYYMLGLLISYTNINQAYLCMEQALHCLKTRYLADGAAACPEDVLADKEVIEEDMRVFREKTGFAVHDLSVIIVSFNDSDIMKKNLEALHRDLPEGAHEVIVIDNHSTDGIAEWLRTQNGVRLIENGDNVGFPVACNIGYLSMREENDVFLLNNDAVCAPGALFWLRMGLYEDFNVGAVGAVSNNASTQTLKDAPHTFDKCMEFGAYRAVPMDHPYEDRVRFTGFALMVKNEAHRAVRNGGELLDARFSPGYFEDDDLGIRIAQAGYRQLLCHNAFVYHRGGTGFKSRKEELTSGRQRFIEKWGFDIWAYEAVWDELTDLVEEEKNAHFAVLELNTGMGADLSAIRYRYPYCYAAGTEPNPVVAGCGKNMADILCGDAETLKFPWEEGFFRYIIASDAIRYAREPARFLKKLSMYLAPGGVLIYVQPAQETEQARVRRLVQEAGFTAFTVRDDLVRVRKQ